MNSDDIGRAQPEGSAQRAVLAGFSGSSFRSAVVLLGLVWFGLNGLDGASWMVGGPVILATSAVLAMWPGSNSLAIRWTAILPFAAYFLTQSLLGGWDVAWRVLRPAMSVAPGSVTYQTTLPPGNGRNLFLAVISLLPGTLTADARGQAIRVHCLDTGQDPELGLRKLETLIAALLPHEMGGRS